MEVSEGKQHDKITRQKLTGTYFISTHISLVKASDMAKSDVSRVGMCTLKICNYQLHVLQLKIFTSKDRCHFSLLEGRVFCRMSFSLGFSDVSLIIRRGLWGCGEEACRGKLRFSSHGIKSRSCQHDVSLLTLTSREGLDSSTLKLFVFPLFGTVLFAKKSLCTAHA